MTPKPATGQKAAKGKGFAAECLEVLPARPEVKTAPNSPQRWDTVCTKGAAKQHHIISV